MRLTDITFCKTFNLDQNYSFSGHTHATYETNIIFSGNMEVTVEGDVIKLSAGDMLVWSPNMFHFNRVACGDTVRFVSVHFSCEDSEINDNTLCYHHFDYEKMAIATAFTEEVQKYGFECKSAAYSLLEALVFMCICDSGSPVLSRDSSATVYSKAAQMMSKNQDKILTIPEMAQSCGVCATTLKSSFKRHSGKSIKKYYCELKLDTAKNLLFSGLTAEETAFKLGFSSPSYFSQFFKKNTGIGVREYINKLKSNREYNVSRR